MKKPYLVYRNGLLYRRRMTLAFVLKDMRELEAQGFKGSYAYDLNGGH